MLFKASLLTALLSASFSLSSPVQVEKRNDFDHKCLALTSANLNTEHKELTSSKLINDVYDDFQPQTTVAAYFNDQYNDYGENLNALTDTLLAPKVYFPTPEEDDDDTYTVIMNDPDAPLGLGSPSFLHWIRRGLKPNCASPATEGGSDVRLYLFPTPPPLVPPTKHRYAISILREPKEGYKPSYLENLLKLSTFDIRKFEQETGAKVIGSTYFLGSSLG